MSNLIHELVFTAAERTPDAEALCYRQQRMDYARLADEIKIKAGALHELGLTRGERVAVYLEKRLETVIALFATTAANGVFVPVNPLLKPEQVTYILIDCNVRILVTSLERLKLLQGVLQACHDLRAIVIVDAQETLPALGGILLLSWHMIHSVNRFRLPSVNIDSDMAAILYTSGSTGKPKGVVLSHRNLITGAKCVSYYLENKPSDRILTVLPLSFDYGLSQLTTAFYVGATNVLINYLLPRDIIDCVKDQNITGLAAVPSLWIQLAQLDWEAVSSLRYVTNSGGVMPRSTLSRLRNALPNSHIFLMYGFTEAFRSTYLPPHELDQRPDSIGKAIPNAEILVLRDDGSPCVAGEPGELVHRGALVSMGYWNDADKTAQCFKPIPTEQVGLTLPEIAAWSGDIVRLDEEGYLYFIERRDEMIKTSGYRISPTEVEEVIYATDCVDEAVAMGVPHPLLGQAIVVIASRYHETLPDTQTLLTACKQKLPSYMQPSFIDIREGHLPRNSNGKIDRKLLFKEIKHLFVDQNQ